VVITELLGVPSKNREYFKVWSNAIIRAVGVRQPPEVYAELGRMIAQLYEYLRGIFTERRQHPQDDLISALLAVEEEQNGRLSEDEALATCALLLSAGHETTVNLISNGVLALLHHPEQLAKLKAEPELAPNAIEEILRYESPAQANNRWVYEDMEFGGKTLRRGDHVYMMFGAANRDPAYFSQPNQLDISRKVGKHVAFGLGIHFCIGAPLARAEGQIGITTLLQRLPNLALQTDKQPEWSESVVVRGLKKLFVRF
jgi:pimeloyl-[acyl-carrier protein] synthase